MPCVRETPQPLVQRAPRGLRNGSPVVSASAFAKRFRLWIFDAEGHRLVSRFLFFSFLPRLQAQAENQGLERGENKGHLAKSASPSPQSRTINTWSLSIVRSRAKECRDDGKFGEISFRLRIFRS